MNSCGKGETEKHPLTSSDLQCSFHQTRGCPSEPHNYEGKSAKVKHRKTRRERNSARFGKNAPDRISEQRSNCRGLQKMLPPFWSSQLSRCAKSIPIQPIEGTCTAKPVIITQNRLTQHLGMFNREVKSADIERLLSPRTDPVVTELTPIQSDVRTEMVMVNENQSCFSCDAKHNFIPNEEFASTEKELSGMKEDSLPTVVGVVHVSTEEHYSMAVVQDVNARSHPSVVSPTVEFNQHATETLAFQSNAPVALNEKEDAPPSPAAKEPGKGRSLVKKLAQELQKLIDLKAIFPGCKLISETREAVISVLQEQKKTLPDSSALAQLKKLASCCNKTIVHAGRMLEFKSPESRDQEGLQHVSKTGDCRSRSSDQGVHFKKRRQEPFFFASSFPSAVHTSLRMAADRPVEEESIKSFVEPEVFDQNSFGLTTVQHHPHLLSASSQHMHSARTSFASGEQCPLLQVNSGRQETSEVAKRITWGGNIPKKHCMPFIVRDILDPVIFSMNGKDPDTSLLTDLQLGSHNYELSPDQWNLQGTEIAAHLNLSQEQDNSLLLDMGLRSTTERTPPESQTSFDVLKSIWSPKLPSRGARWPMPRVVNYSCLTQQPPSTRELYSWQRQPEGLLQRYSTPSQQQYFCRQNAPREVCVSSRHQQHGDELFSVMAKPRTYCQTVSGKQVKLSNGQQVRGPIQASPERMQGGRGRSSSRTHDLERLLQSERAQPRKVFQQLPMSYFPPSEALEENINFPLCTFQGHMLGQASPEPWDFPRMKLY